MTKPNENVAKLKIYDQTYSVQGEETAEYYEQLAQYVDGKMRKISAGAKVADTQKLAVLAALNIADDYFKIKEAFEDLVRLIEERSRAARKKLDAVLAEPQARQ